MLRHFYRGLCAIDGALKRIIANRYTYRLAELDPTGLVEMLLFSWRLDLWHRYGAIRQTISSEVGTHTLRILDAGGGSGKIAEFIDPSTHFICVLERRKAAIRALPSGLRGVMGDMLNLPFKEQSFDAVVSADALEHIPARNRPECLKEMRRVSAHAVVIHCPIQQENAGFVATHYDLKFNRTHRYIFGTEEPNIREHIQSGTPTLDQIRQILPDLKTFGTQNARIWYICLLMGRLPLIGLMTGLVYRVFFHRSNAKPPYYTGLLVHTRTKGRPV